MPFLPRPEPQLGVSIEPLPDLSSPYDSDYDPHIRPHPTPIDPPYNPKEAWAGTPTSPRNTLLALHDRLTKRARDLMDRKNADYSTSDDPFANFRLCEAISGGTISTEAGILIRMTDKISRLYQLLNKEASVAEETIEDTCLDLINYAVLFLAVREPKE